MTKCVLCWCAAAAFACAYAPPSAEGGDLPTGATVLDPDIYLYSWPNPTISPDGNWVAYVSRGYVCICNVKTPARRRVMEVPHSWTWPHFVVSVDESSLSGPFDSLSRGLNRDERRELLAQVTSTVYGFQWTDDSNGFVFGVQARDSEQKRSTSDTYYTSVEGALTRLAHVDSDALTRGIVGGILTRDRKFLVSHDNTIGSFGHYRPLIWSAKDNKPKATCYLYLTPSTTSNRWLGIEKDTRQLVIVNSRFEVERRFDETVPETSFGFDLYWSPDEQFIIWRNQIGFDHYSNWEGFWMNLKTGEKRELSGRFMAEQFGFTGHGGEFYRCGQTGDKTNWYDAVVGAHLTIVTEGDSPDSDLWRIKVDPRGPKPGALTNRPGNPPLRMSPNGDLFAIGLPRPAGERSGFDWHLMDRGGRSWRFPGEDNGEFNAPYEVAGFADNGTKIVAYDATCLFTIPVSTIKGEDSRIKQ